MAQLRLIVFLLTFLDPSARADDSTPKTSGTAGTVPVDKNGRELNLGFEAGSLQDWMAEGTAFEGQPIEGDPVHRRARGYVQPAPGAILGWQL